MTPSASSAKAIQDDNAYRICFGDPDQGIISADTLAESYTKIGVIYDSSDTYSSGIYASFKEQVKTKERIAVTEKSFTSETAVDFSQQVSDLKNAGCEVVYLPIYYTQANLIIREAVKQSYQPDFFGCDGLDGLKALLEVDNKIADIEGEVSYMTPFDAEAQDEKTKNFVAAYKEAYNGDARSIRCGRLRRGVCTLRSNEKGGRQGRKNFCQRPLRDIKDDDQCGRFQLYGHHGGHDLGRFGRACKRTGYRQALLTRQRRGKGSKKESFSRFRF